MKPIDIFVDIVLPSVLFYCLFRLGIIFLGG
jgi:hypothetical protein